MYIYIYIYMYINMYIYMYINMYIYIYLGRPGGMRGAFESAGHLSRRRAEIMKHQNIPFSFPNSIAPYFTLPYVDIIYPKSFQKPSTLKTLAFHLLPAPPL